MLTSKSLSKLGARARKVATTDATIANGRAALTSLIDEFWLYYRNPSGYTALVKQDNSADVYVAGAWPYGEPLVTKSIAGICVRIPFNGRYLPLTRDGCQEIVLPNSDLAVLEELLASIKHAIQNGQADTFIGGG